MENERSSDGNRLPSNKYSCPWLIISHYALEEQTFYNILEDRSYCAKMIPDILNKFPISTNQPGWVLVQGDRSSFSYVEVEEDETDDEEEDADNTDDDEDNSDDEEDDDEENGDADEIHDDGEEEDDVGDGDADEVHDDGEEEDDVGDGDEFGHEDDDGNEVHEFGHDDDFGSAEAAEECDDGSKVVCFLWNINLSEKIPITDYKGVTDTTSYYDRCLLSPSPSESNCIIYLFKKTSVFFGRLSDPTLSRRVISNVPMAGAVITENGKVMCIFKGGTELVIGTPVYREGWCLDLTRYSTDDIDYPLGTNSYYSYSYFIEYQGELINVKMSTYGENHYNQVHSFWLYRFNFYKKTWELLDDIGRTAIFILGDIDYPTRFGIRCSVSDEDEKKGLRPNSIYFTHYSKFIYVFSMEDQTISYFCPCPIVINYDFQWVLL